MKHWLKPLYLLAAAGLWAQCAAAQLSAPPIPSALPDVSKISMSNAAGVLKYCEQKALVSGAATDAILDAFPNKPDVKSADYTEGAGGQIIGAGGKIFVIGEAPGYLQSSACNMVLEQAKAFRKP